MQATLAKSPLLLPKLIHLRFPEFTMLRRTGYFAFEKPLVSHVG